MPPRMMVRGRLRGLVRLADRLKLRLLVRDRFMGRVLLVGGRQRGCQLGQKGQVGSGLGEPSAKKKARQTGLVGLRPSGRGNHRRPRHNVSRPPAVDYSAAGAGEAAGGSEGAGAGAGAAGAAWRSISARYCACTSWERLYRSVRSPWRDVTSP